MYEKYKDDERALPTTIEEIEALSSYGKRADLIGNLQYNEEGDMVFGFGKHKGVKVADVLTREPGKTFTKAISTMRSFATSVPVVSRSRKTSGLFK